MATLKLTFTGGGTCEFPFHSGSQLTVDTPDGVNGVKHASWGDITGLELAETVDPTPAAPAQPPVDAKPAKS